MKIFIFTLCCIILTLPSTTISGTLGDVFGNVKNRAENVGQDVRSFFGLNKNNNKQQDDVIVFKDEDDTSVTTKQEEITKKVSVPETTTQITTTTAGSASRSNGTADGKEGRDSFNGGCSTGYLRTPDGRCKPTF